MFYSFYGHILVNVIKKSTYETKEKPESTPFTSTRSNHFELIKIQFTVHKSLKCLFKLSVLNRQKISIFNQTFVCLKEMVTF